MLSFVIGLAGAVALLLWAVRMIRTSVERAFMTELRAVLRRGEGHALSAAMGGLGAALMLQSATAVAMLVVAFAGAGTLGVATGIAIILGADLGSALVVRVLVAPIEALVPLLLVAGVALFTRSRSHRLRQTGRLTIGLALVLVALSMIRATTAPLADSPGTSFVTGYLQRDLVWAYLIGGVLAWAMHSSVAAILAFVTLAAGGLLPGVAAAALVLGANLGGAAIPFLLTYSSSEPDVRRIALGNLLLRGGGSALALGALIAWPAAVSYLGTSAGGQAVHMHIAFNLALLAVALPLSGKVAALCRHLLPGSGPAPSRLSALDRSALDNADMALACANREILRMAEEVRAMLTAARGLLTRQIDGSEAMIAEAEDEVDRMHFEVKLYLARVQEGRLSSDQSRRAMDLAVISNNLEEAGDQIANTLCSVARRLRDDGLTFSDQGQEDLLGFHAHILDNARLALNVLMTGDEDDARQLVEEKDRVRAVEQRLQERHLKRLREGAAQTVETSNLHQECLRALKQINACFAIAAYPIMEQSGDLLKSRLAHVASG